MADEEKKEAVAEEPKAEEAKAEEPKAEAPAAEEKKPKAKAEKPKKSSAALDDIMTAIKGMTVIELAELVKALEEEFGVTAAAPVAVAAAGAARLFAFSG